MYWHISPNLLDKYWGYLRKPMHKSESMLICGHTNRGQSTGCESWALMAVFLLLAHSSFTILGLKKDQYKWDFRNLENMVYQNFCCCVLVALQCSNLFYIVNLGSIVRLFLIGTLFLKRITDNMVHCVTGWWTYGGTAHWPTWRGVVHMVDGHAFRRHGEGC